MRRGRVVAWGAVAWSSVTLAGPATARAQGIEVEGRVGTLTQSFAAYDLPEIVPRWGSFSTFDASLRYYWRYFFVGLGGGFAFSVADAGASSDPSWRVRFAFARLWTGAVELGSHVDMGTWVFRPGLGVGIHHLAVTGSENLCQDVTNKQVFTCGSTAASQFFVQPRASFEKYVDDNVYIGVAAGVDVPIAGPVVQFVFGARQRPTRRAPDASTEARLDRSPSRPAGPWVDGRPR